MTPGGRNEPRRMRPVCSCIVRSCIHGVVLQPCAFHVFNHFSQGIRFMTPNTSRRLLLPVPKLMFVLSMVLAACLAQVGEVRAQQSVLVEAVQVQVRALADDVSAVGTLLSNESVLLRPEVAGRIAAIHFREGAPVRRGDLLVELDAAVQRAELQQAEANLRLSESNYRRNLELFERKFVTQSMLDTVSAEREVARAGVEVARARFERTRIRAPFDAVASLRSVSPGDYVKEGDALVRLEDIAVLKADFRLPETYVARIRQGQPLELVSDVLPGERFRATVDAIDPLVDAQGRSVVLRASLPNPAGRLRPGMFVRVRLILDERPSALLVPEEALVPAPGNTHFVYQVVDGKAQRVPVRIGLRRDAQVEVVEGLAPGAVVVTAGQLKLREGTVVRLADPSGDVQ